MKEQPRLCILASPTTPNAGVYNYWARTVSALHERGIEASLFLGHADIDPLSPTKLSLTRESRRWIETTFADYVKAGDFTHLITSIPQSDILTYASRRAFPRECRIVTFAHGVPYPVAGQTNRLKTWAWRTAWRRAASHADSRAAISPTLARRLSAEVRSPFNIVTPTLPGSFGAARELWQGPPRIGYIGRLSYEKDPLLFADIVQLHPMSYVHVVGDGPLQLQAQNALPGANFHGSLPEVDSVYSELDIVMVTSRSEGLSLVILEASLAGVLPLAVAVGGTPDAIAPSLRGELLIPLEKRTDVTTWRDRLRRFQDVEARARAIQEQRAWVAERFSTEAAITSLLTGIGGQPA